MVSANWMNGWCGAPLSVARWSPRSGMAISLCFDLDWQEAGKGRLYLLNTVGQPTRTLAVLSQSSGMRLKSVWTRNAVGSIQKSSCLRPIESMNQSCSQLIRPSASRFWRSSLLFLENTGGEDTHV